MTIDELMGLHPAPWRLRQGLDWYSVEDANGHTIFNDGARRVRREMAGDICDAIQELARLRALPSLNVPDGVTVDLTGVEGVARDLVIARMLHAAADAAYVEVKNERDTLRARNAELEAYVVRMRDAPKRLAEALLAEMPYKPSTKRGQWSMHVLSEFAQSMRLGHLDEALYGDGGAL